MIGAVIQALAAAAAHPPGGSLRLTSGLLAPTTQQSVATLGFEPSFVVPSSATTLDFPFSSLTAWPAQKGISISLPTWPVTVAEKPQ